MGTRVVRALENRCEIKLVERAQDNDSACEYPRIV